MRERCLQYVVYFRKNRFLFLILGAVIFLSTIGLLILASASLSFIQSNYLQKQSLWLLLAVVCFALGMLLPMSWLRHHSKWIYLLAAVLLAIVLIPGVGLSIKGSRRWLNLGIFHFQVSEFAKVGLLLHLSNYLARHEEFARNLREGFFLPCLLIGFLASLVLLEPDYGTTALFLVVGLTLLFLNGVRLRPLLLMALLLLLLFAVFIALNPVRLGRILAFWDMESTKLTGSYQLWQGIVGFNAGGISGGAGLGNGIQQLAYLPESHTDFIFPILAEELGYLFALGIILTYGLIFLLGWYEIYRIHSRFLFLLCSGILTMIIYQAAINLGVVMGLLPTKGMALPLISYGGSNLILIYFLFGLLLNGFCTAYFDRDAQEIS